MKTIRKRNYLTWYDRLLNRLFTKANLTLSGMVLVLCLLPAWVSDGMLIPFNEEVEVSLLERFSNHGIDVSHHNGPIDWDMVKQYNSHHSAVKFAFVKATEGKDFIDKRYSSNWQNLKRVNITRGAYHFFRPNVDPKLQALNYILQVKLEPGDFPPVLDFEIDARNKNTLSKNLKVWLETIEKHYGVKPIIYTNTFLYHKYIKSEYPTYPVWISQYNTPELSNIEKQDVLFWQYTVTGKVEGIQSDVDFNVFLSGEREFKQLLIN